MSFFLLFSLISDILQKRYFLVPFCLHKTKSKISTVHRCFVKALCGVWVTRSTFSKQTATRGAESCRSSHRTTNTLQITMSTSISHREHKFTLACLITASLLKAIMHNTEQQHKSSSSFKSHYGALEIFHHLIPRVVLRNLSLTSMLSLGISVTVNPPEAASFY